MSLGMDSRKDQVHGSAAKRKEKQGVGVMMLGRTEGEEGALHQHCPDEVPG